MSSHAGARSRTIVGNWKMHKTPDEARALAATLVAALKDPPAGVEVVVCPPFPALEGVARALRGSTVRLGAQDVAWEDRGAFTGAVSVPMVAACGATHVIVGHSERRAHFGETDETVAAKLRACWRGGVTPILCVGETAQERLAGLGLEVIARQVAAALSGSGPHPLIAAYEPVWAIGGGRAASPEDGGRGIAAVREAVARAWGAGAEISCLYGGSVSPENCRPYWSQGGADGALVGGASLDAAAFSRICRQAAVEAGA